MWGYDHAAMGLMGGFGMVLVWLLPIALLVWLFARTAGGRRGHSEEANRSPLETLDERYARGEIGPEEYRSRRADLQHKDTGEHA